LTRNAVLGGGALGLTAALRLLQRGEEVVLYEREPVPGGLAAGFRVGPSYLEKFYHHLFRSDTFAIAMIEELGLGDKLIWPCPVTSTLIGGKPQQLDSALSLLRFSPLPFLDRLRLGFALLYLRREPNYHRLEHTTAEAWIRRYMGERVFEVLWQPLLRSKFGDRASEIAMPWFWARTHFRSTSLGYLRGGFQQLYDSLVAAIEILGGTTCFATEVQAIVPHDDGTLTVRTGAGEQRFDRVISTLPTKLTINLTAELQGDYDRQYGSLQSYGAHCAILMLDRPLTDIYWLNVNDPGYPFLALVEHTNYMPPEDYDGKRIVYLGNYLPMSHELFSMSPDDILARYVPALKRVNPSFDESWITEYKMFKAPFAQPIVTLGYADRLPSHRTPVANLYLANMSQVYPQDRGQNYSIAMAERLIQGLAVSTSPS
jgi:protoporphyrinogen oxidase